MGVATWDDVARILDGLPLTTEQSAHEWRVGNKLLAWERPLRPSEREALARNGSAAPDGDLLGVRVADEGVKFALIAEEPTVYFTTPHFNGYPAVLVDLAEIGVGELEELIIGAWLTRAPKKFVREFLNR